MAKRGRKPLYGKSLEEIFAETGASRSVYRRLRHQGKSHEDALALAMGADVPSNPDMSALTSVEPDARVHVTFVADALTQAMADSVARAVDELTEPDMSALTSVEPDAGAWGPAG